MARELKPRPVIGRNKIAVPLPGLGEPETLARPSSVRRQHRAELVNATRYATAAEALQDMGHDVDIEGMSKGRYSLLDLIKATLEHTGPAHLHISTWTAALAEVGELAEMAKRGKLLSIRWLADISLGGRDRGVMQAILMHFGPDSVRVTKNHAKFCVFVNGEWSLLLRSSMNLNMNPRNENYQLLDDPELSGWYLSIMDAIFDKQKFDIDNAAKHRREFQSGAI